MLRFHLPPNLVAAAARDAVAVRVEMNLAVAPPPELLPALALLQRWCGPKPPAFLQLRRSQLRELVAVVGELPVFVENGRPGPWSHDDLLTEPTAATPAAAPAEAARLRRSATEAAAPLQIDGSEHFLALTLPSREHPRYADALALVRENGFVLETSNRKWWLRDRHKTLNFLAAHLPRLREAFGAEFTPNFEKNTARIQTAEIAVDVAPAGGDFNVTVGLRAGKADDATLRDAVAGNRGYLETDGKIFLLEADRLKKIAAAQATLAGEPFVGFSARRTLRVSSAATAAAQELLEELSPNFQPPETWKTRSAALRDLTVLAPAPIPPSLGAQLRPYQRLGAAWLWHLARHNLAGILADEMGLGKTLQALALLSATEKPPLRDTAVSDGPRLSAGRVPPIAPSPTTSLVICPASLLENWRRETARFAPQLRSFVHHGSARLGSAAELAAYDLVITSYGTLARDQALFTDTELRYVIADEAQHIKNRRSQNAAALRALRARSRFLLTGTPLENSLDDLRSLFDFLLPGYLPRLPAGLRADERGWHDQRLRAYTAPYILRRTKRAVAPELPDKIEQIIWCELAPAQARLYRETQERGERELFDLEAGGASESKLQFAALTQLLRLRQIACDPRLVNPGRATDPDSAGTPPGPASGSFAQADPDLAGGAPPANTAADSAKLDAFLELIAEAVDDGHRVLVFSQFTSLLALLREELNAQNLAHCYLDGSMSPRARQAEVDRFQGNAEIPLFLLSLKAGGTGLNLTGADTVVHFDPWWNPAAEAQATDRAHRIGQSRVVTSYKLIAAGTVEEKVLALQAEKRALLADVFEASDAASARLSLADLKDLLR